ncbi:hypothetical protein D3C87_1668920 [compost metagenome]
MPTSRGCATPLSTPAHRARTARRTSPLSARACRKTRPRWCIFPRPTVSMSGPRASPLAAPIPSTATSPPRPSWSIPASGASSSGPTRPTAISMWGRATSPPCPPTCSAALKSSTRAPVSSSWCSATTIRARSSGPPASSRWPKTMASSSSRAASWSTPLWGKKCPKGPNWNSPPPPRS